MAEKQMTVETKDRPVNTPWIPTGKINGKFTINSKLTGELICLVEREGLRKRILEAVNNYWELRPLLDEAVKALERIDKRCLKYGIIPKRKICLDIASGFSRCHGCNAADVLTKLQQAGFGKDYKEGAQQ